MRESMKSIVILGVILVLALGITGCDDDDGILQDNSSLDLNVINATAQGTTVALKTVQSLAGAIFAVIGSSSASVQGGNGKCSKGVDVSKLLCEFDPIGGCDPDPRVECLFCNDGETSCEEPDFCIGICENAQFACEEECAGDEECFLDCDMNCTGEDCEVRFEDGSACFENDVLTVDGCDIPDFGEIDGTITAVKGKGGFILTVDLTINGEDTLDGDIVIVPEGKFGAECFFTGYRQLTFSNGATLGLELVMLSPDFPTPALEQCVGKEEFPDCLTKSGSCLTTDNIDFDTTFDWIFDATNIAQITVTEGENPVASCSFDLELNDIVPAPDSSGLCPAGS